jgi:hypothetical protein
MCKTCGCGDVDEYDEDIEELADDDPAWAYALQREDDMSVTHDQEGLEEPEEWDQPESTDDQEDERDNGDEW